MWKGACVVKGREGHVWKGACVVKGACVEGGICGEGGSGMCGSGHVW